MDVARLGLAHGPIEASLERIDHLRTASAEVGRPVGILVDLPGPKVRSAPFGEDGVELVPGTELLLTEAEDGDRSTAVRVAVDGKRHDGVASFGRRPTFDNGAPLLEVFLFDFSGDLYGRHLDVAFIGWIRAEEKFESLEALIAQMDIDSQRARETLTRAGDVFPALGDIS